MERYVKYLRKSRFDRDYAELSIEETLKRHEDILDKLARDRGFYVSKTYYEVVSGESIAARPQIQKMLDEVSAGVYAGVLVVDLERLARGNGADQAYISQVFQFSGTRIITPLKEYDPSNEFDEEYFEFGLFMSRREYKTINRRLIRGRDSSAAEGKYIGSIAPYGYQRFKLENEKGYTLIEHPEEADVVRKIFELYQHYSGTKVIANYLNDRGVPTRHGDLWTYSTITNIITNPVYMGKIRRGWSRQIKSFENGVVKKHIKRKKSMDEYDIYDGLHPALISEAEFMRVQEIREGKCYSPRVKTAHTLQNPFAGLLYCSCCGQRVGRTVTSKKRGSVPRVRCVNSRNCHNGTANFDVVEKEIITALRQWLEGYRVKIDAVGFAEEIAQCEKKIARLQQEEAKIQRQLENAYDLVEQEIYTLEVFKERRDKLVSKMSAIRRQVNRAQNAKEKMEEGADEQFDLIPQTEALLDSYDAMTAEEQNKLLKAILYKIKYQKGKEGGIVIDIYPRLPHM